MGQAEIEGPHPAWSMRCFQAEVPLATRELREAWRRKGVGTSRRPSLRNRPEVSVQL